MEYFTVEFALFVAAASACMGALSNALYWSDNNTAKDSVKNKIAKLVSPWGIMAAGWGFFFLLRYLCKIIL